MSGAGCWRCYLAWMMTRTAMKISKIIFGYPRQKKGEKKGEYF
jgi:hypothetical protein